jgi:hypothetical protein
MDQRTRMAGRSQGNRSLRDPVRDKLGFVIADEARNVENAATRNFQALLQLIAPDLILATATPVSNRLTV